MSSPYPPQTPPRRFERSRNNRVLGGVCAGLANYLNMDVTLVRVLTVVVSLFTGVPVVAYIVALFLVPEEKAAPYVGPEPTTSTPPTAPTASAGQTDPVWGPDGAPWDQAQSGATPPQPSPQPSPQPAPATAAPESPVETGSVPDPEPVAETATPEPAPGQESSWESAPAEPENADSEPSGDTPPSGPTPREGHKPTS